MEMRGRFSHEGLKYSVGYGSSSVNVSHNDLQNGKAEKQKLFLSELLMRKQFCALCTVVHISALYNLQYTKK